MLNPGLVAVIIVGAWRVSSGEMKPGAIVAFLTYFTIILNAIMAVSRMVTMSSKAIASADRVAEVLLTPADMEVSEWESEQKLYREFAIEPAASMLKMMSFAALKKVVRSTKRGFRHGEYEGIEEQLPAAFLLQRDGTVLWAHYGKDVGDVPTARELAERMKS